MTSWKDMKRTGNSRLSKKMNLLIWIFWNHLLTVPNLHQATIHRFQKKMEKHHAKKTTSNLVGKVKLRMSNVRKINIFLKEWFERLEIIKYLLPKYAKISPNTNGMNYKLLYGLPLMPSIFQIKKWLSKNAWHKKSNDNMIYFIHITHSVLLTYLPISCIFKYNVFSF